MYVIFILNIKSVAVPRVKGIKGLCPMSEPQRILPMTLSSL